MDCVNRTKDCWWVIACYVVMVDSRRLLGSIHDSTGYVHWNYRWLLCLRYYSMHHWKGLKRPGLQECRYGMVTFAMHSALANCTKNQFRDINQLPPPKTHPARHIVVEIERGKEYRCSTDVPSRLGTPKVSDGLSEGGEENKQDIII